MIKILRKFFGDLKISYGWLVTTSVIIGIIVGVLNRIPALDGTSLQDPAIVFDVWIVLAIMLIMNCHKASEAVTKCFLFFLISQPVIYLVEAMMDAMAGADFWTQMQMYFVNYYWGAGWLTWTFLTIPGAWIAYQVKRDNIVSALILAVATGWLMFMAVEHFVSCFSIQFPNHLLSGVFCLVASIGLIAVLLTGKRERLVAGGLTLLGGVVAIIMAINTRSMPAMISSSLEYPDEIVPVSVESNDENVATVELISFDDGSKPNITVRTGKKFGQAEIRLTDTDGNIYIYEVDSSYNNFEIKLAE